MLGRRGWLLMLLWVSFVSIAFGQIPRPEDAPRPLSPAESAKRFSLPLGFRMELVAAEPLVEEPSALAWDEFGRFYVAEMHGYNLEGQYDIEELNKTGQLDRVVRRVQADERHKKAAEANTYGAIKLLTDADGDGVMDKAHIWAERIQPCLGICPARGGLIAVGQTEIVFLADRDGDGKAEVRELLYSGFAPGPLERTINAPQFALDNWIYVGRGAGGGKITGPNLDASVDLPATDFRIKADGSAIEPITGATKTVGCAFNAAGDRFVVSTRDPAIFVAPLAWNDLARNPYYAPSSMEVTLTSDPTVHPTSPPHPWRTRRAEDPGFSKYYRDRYGEAESAANGYLTSGCSPLIYQDSVLPGLQGVLFTCEPAQNLVFRAKIEQQGARYAAHRLAEDAKQEFLCSSDPWFHAIALSHAPDGCIYVVDFYREIIEDYSAIPRYLQQEYGLVNGKDRGRIWKLTHESLSKVAHQKPPGGMSDKELAEAAASENYWRRTTARRRLLERVAVSEAPLLRGLLHGDRSPAVMVNLLATLSGLESLNTEDILLALSHAGAGVRRQGIRLSRPFLAKEPEILHRVVELAGDADALVQLAAAVAISDVREPEAAAAIAKLAEQHGEDPWFVAAILSGASESAPDLLRSLAGASAEESTGALSVTSALASSIGARRDSAQLSDTLDLLTIGKLGTKTRQRLLLALNAGLARGTPRRLDSTAAEQAVVKLVGDPNAEIRTQAIRLAGFVELGSSPSLVPVWKEAADRAGDASKPLSARAQAIEQLGVAGASQHAALAAFFDARQPIELQLAAVEAVGNSASPDIVSKILENYSRVSPGAQLRMIEVAFARRERIPELLTCLEKGLISAADLPPDRRTQLLEDKRAEVRSAAESLFAKLVPADKQELLKTYQAALQSPRDAAHGKAVFEKQCSKCHELGESGFAVGPDLDSVRSRPDESLLTDVLDPSGVINPKYRAYTALSNDGRIFTGLLTEETATSITLTKEKSEKQVILRRDLEELRASAKSIMPEGMEKEMSPKDAADLFAFIRSAAPSVLNRLALFDDESSFAGLLREGEGTAALDFATKVEGLASLRITGGQRFSPRIADWKFSIVEHPQGENEFRYLRLSWKAAGEGAMLELAADGKWPDANSPKRRYFSGRNTTKWAAKVIDENAPAEWKQVTMDLWKDNGDFTLTGIAPTTLGEAAWFDQVELLKTASQPR